MSTDTNTASELLTLLREREEDVDRYEDALLLIAERIDGINNRIEAVEAHSEDERQQLHEQTVERARMHANLTKRVVKLERSRTYTRAVDGDVHLSEAERSVLGMSNSLANPSGPERRAMAIIENWDSWARSTQMGKYLDITTGNLDKLLEQSTGEKLDNKQVYDAMERAETLTDGKLRVRTRRFGGQGRKRKILESSGEELILTEEDLAEVVSELDSEAQSAE